MQTNYKHIHPDFQKLMTLSKEDRIYSLDKDFIIYYPKVKEVIQVMSNFMNKPKKDRMQNLLLIGDPNMGKTTIAKKFYAMNPNKKIETIDGTTVLKPVIYVNIQGSSEKEFYTSILDQFWAPYKISHSTLKLKQQTIHLLKICQVKTIIFDELHNLLRGTPIKQCTILDQIKNLSNELKIPMIGVGTKAAATLLYNDPQLVSRFDIIKLNKWDLNQDFRGLLQSFEKRLPLKKPSFLASKEKAVLLYELCQGNLGYLHQVLIACAEYAIKKDIEEITQEIIETIMDKKLAQITNPKDYATS